MPILPYSQICIHLSTDILLFILYVYCNIYLSLSLSCCVRIARIQICLSIFLCKQLRICFSISINLFFYENLNIFFSFYGNNLAIIFLSIFHVHSLASIYLSCTQLSISLSFMYIAQHLSIFHVHILASIYLSCTQLSIYLSFMYIAQHLSIFLSI